MPHPTVRGFPGVRYKPRASNFSHPAAAASARHRDRRDQLEVAINGVVLPAEGFQYAPVGYLAGWLAAAIPSAALHSGRNEIGLRIVARAPKLKSKLIVEAAEVLISFQ